MKRILVLSGGGLEGIINHLGFYKAFYKLNYHKDLYRVIGTSAGAIVGAFISAEYNPEILRSILLNELFSCRFICKILDNPFNMFLDGALLRSKALLDIYKEYLPSSFNDLKIKFNALATEMDTGTLKVFGKSNEDLYLAVLASQSIPGIFPYVEYNGHYYLDGAVIRNVGTNLIYRYATYMEHKYKQNFAFYIVDMDGTRIDPPPISHNPIQILYNSIKIARRYYEAAAYDKLRNKDNIYIYDALLDRSIFAKRNILRLKRLISYEIDRLSEEYYKLLINK